MIGIKAFFCVKTGNAVDITSVSVNLGLAFLNVFAINLNRLLSPSASMGRIAGKPDKP
ncbi:MAG: hypothetical protein M0Z56_06105 [Desulfobacteraceae bacterium]|nr:hypothetical protein [Desulfobacteraceae bacterium]